MSVKLWEGRRLLDLDLLRNDRDAPIGKSLLSKISKFLSVVSQDPEISSCGGIGVDVRKTLDRAPCSKVRVQYLFIYWTLKV